MRNPYPMPRERPPEPWNSFLADIDGHIDQRVVLHCIGGFAIAMLYNLPRPTLDIDCLGVIPVNRSGETLMAVHLAHAARADRCKGFVRAELRNRGERHRGADRFQLKRELPLAWSEKFRPLLLTDAAEKCQIPVRFL